MNYPSHASVAYARPSRLGWITPAHWKLFIFGGVVMMAVGAALLDSLPGFLWVAATVVMGLGVTWAFAGFCLWVLRLVSPASDRTARTIVITMTVFGLALAAGATLLGIATDLLVA